MAVPNLVSDEVIRKCLRQHVKVFKDQCHLCRASTTSCVPQICTGCGKFEYCSTYCLTEDMRDHYRYCKLNYPKIKTVTRGYWRPLVSRSNASNTPRTPAPPQDDSEDKPRTSSCCPGINLSTCCPFKILKLVRSNHSEN